MVNSIIVDILVKRIKNGGINPKTSLPMVLEDIKIQEYKDTVQEQLNTQ